MALNRPEEASQVKEGSRNSKQKCGRESWSPESRSCDTVLVFWGGGQKGFYSTLQKQEWWLPKRAWFLGTKEGVALRYQRGC